MARNVIGTFFKFFELGPSLSKERKRKTMPLIVDTMFRHKHPRAAAAHTFHSSQFTIIYEFQNVLNMSHFRLCELVLILFKFIAKSRHLTCLPNLSNKLFVLFVLHVCQATGKYILKSRKLILWKKNSVIHNDTSHYCFTA